VSPDELADLLRTQQATLFQAAAQLPSAILHGLLPMMNFAKAADENDRGVA